MHTAFILPAPSFHPHNRARRVRPKRPRSRWSVSRRPVCAAPTPARSPDNFWNRIRTAVPLSHVFRDHLGPDALIERKPAQFVVKCPFHPDNNPSCIINDSTATFHCFGCGAHGSVIDFEMHTRALQTPLQALQSLSARYPSIAALSQQTPTNPPPAPAPLPKPQPKSWRQIAQQKRLVANVLLSVHHLYVDQLWGPDNPALHYLRARQLSDNTIRQFACGYAGPQTDWHRTVNHLVDAGFAQSHAVTAGVAAAAKNGSVYDLFRGRVVTPIRDIAGKVIAFSGRILGDPDSYSGYVPKYVNGPETPLFRKRDVLFGADLAVSAPSCRDDAGYLVIVEGYMDAMTMYDRTAGKVGVVATMGAAITLPQINIAVHLLEDPADSKVIVNFDGDDAGYAAAERMCDNVLPQADRAHLVYIAMPPQQVKDPDEFLSSVGTADEYLKHLQETALPWYEWKGKSIVFRELERMETEMTSSQLDNVEQFTPAQIQSLLGDDESMETIDFDIMKYMSEYRSELLAAMGAPSEFIAKPRKSRPRPRCSEDTVDKLAQTLYLAHKSMPGLNVGALVHSWADSLSCGDGTVITPLFKKIIKRAEEISGSRQSFSPMMHLDMMPPPPWVVDELPKRKKKAFMAANGMSDEQIGITDFLANPKRRKKSFARIEAQREIVNQILRNRSGQAKRLRARPRRTAEEIILRVLIFASEADRLDCLNALLEVLIRCEEKGLPFWTSPHRARLFEFLAEVEGTRTPEELAEKVEDKEWWIPEIEELFSPLEEEADPEWKAVREIEISAPVEAVTCMADSVQVMAGKVASEMALEETSDILEEIMQAQSQNDVEKVDHLIAKQISLKSAVDRTKYLTPDELESREEELRELRTEREETRKIEMVLELVKTQSVPHPSERPPWLLEESELENEDF